MQLQQQAQRDFITRAKMLAHVMTSTKNIDVTISGNQAYCSFGHINLPAGDYTCPTFVKMVQGWIDHELGHEDESLPQHAKQAAQNKVLSDIFGRIEDVRMESSRGRKFRGAKTNLAVLAELAIERELFVLPTQEHSIGALIINHILYRGRSKVIGQNCLDEFASIGHSLIAEQVNQPFADGLNQLIDKAATLTDSQGSLDLSREILAFIEQEEIDQEQQQDQAEQDSQDDSDPQDSQSDSSNSDNQPSDSSSESTDSNAPSDNQTDNDDSDTENPDASASSESSDDVDKISSGSDSSSTSPTQSLKLIQSMQEYDAKDFHEAIADMISEDVAQQTDQASNTPDFDYVVGSSHYDFRKNALDVSLARRLSANVYQALHKVIVDIQPELPVTRKRGKRISSRLFSSIPAGNTKVFHSRVDKEVREAAVTLVIDASPSMTMDSRIQHANTCALAFALALQRLGIAFEVIYFGSMKDSRFQMYRPKTFDSKLNNSAFGVYTGNYSTPTGQAMQFALSSLVLRKENNKLMLLLTDGDPDCYRKVEQSHQLAKVFGVSVVPFALCTEYVLGFEKHEFVSIPDASGLTPALRQATKQKLFA